MRCEDLNRLLQVYYRSNNRDIVNQLITSHILSCSSCALGLHQLAQELLALDTLTCEQCRPRLPSYYEATHPDHPQVTLPDATIAEVALHMGHCRDCSQLYAALVQVSEIEERGELRL
jgi:hypothetical protein